MLKHSRANVISSPGFKRCLPKREYYLSHNFDIQVVREALSREIKGSFNEENGLVILTIGAIRDLSSNMEVVKALGNEDGVKMSFVGKGDAAIIIEEYCKNNEIKNVSFRGFYQKQEEAGIVQDATFLNIFYPRIITHDTALSNRFYNSLIYKKPMLVTKGTTQGDYAQNYQVGVSVDNCNNLLGDLRSFILQDYYSYAQRCNDLLASFLKDQEQFEQAVKKFVS